MQRTHTNEEMMATGGEFAAGLRPRARAATLVALSGELGAGKTTFVKGAALSLGIEEHVTSPTFVIMKIYDLHGPVDGFKKFVHMDAYRLKGMQHLKVLGWDELVRDPGNLIFVEWPEKIDGAIPADAIHLTFRYSGDNGRVITYGKEEANNERA